MRNSLLTILFFALSLNSTFAQKNLEPTDGFFVQPDYSQEYHQNIKTLLLSKLGDKKFAERSYLTFINTPSHENEKAFVIKFHKGQAYIILGEAKKRIWNTKAKETSRIKTTQKKISLADTDLLGQLWDVAILNAEFAPYGVPGGGGTNYYFIIDSYPRKSAYTWSPGEETRTGKLVSIGNQIIDLMNRKLTNTLQLDSKMKAEIQNLIYDFRQKSFYLNNQKYLFYLDYSFETKDIENNRPIFIIKLNIQQLNGKQVEVVFNCRDGIWPEKPEFVDFECFYHPVNDLKLNDTEFIRKITNYILLNYDLNTTRKIENGLDLIEKIEPIEHRYN